MDPPSDPDCYPLVIDRSVSIPVITSAPPDIDNQKLVYALILRRGYRNTINEHLKVFNAIFNPALESYTMPLPGRPRCDFVLRPQMTLLEWQHLVERQLPPTEAEMKASLEALMCRIDFKIEMSVGGEGRHRRVQWHQGSFRWVEDFMKTAAKRCGVLLVVREDLRREG